MCKVEFIVKSRNYSMKETCFDMSNKKVWEVTYLTASLYPSSSVVCVLKRKAV